MSVFRPRYVGIRPNPGICGPSFVHPPGPAQRLCPRSLPGNRGDFACWFRSRTAACAVGGETSQERSWPSRSAVVSDHAAFLAMESISRRLSTRVRASSKKSRAVGRETFGGWPGAAGVTSTGNSSVGIGGKHPLRYQSRIRNRISGSPLEKNAWPIVAWTAGEGIRSEDGSPIRETPNRSANTRYKAMRCPLVRDPARAGDWSRLGCVPKKTQKSHCTNPRDFYSLRSRFAQKAKR